MSTIVSSQENGRLKIGLWYWTQRLKVLIFTDNGDMRNLPFLTFIGQVEHIVHSIFWLFLLYKELSGKIIYSLFFFICILECKIN